MPFGEIWTEYCRVCGAPADGEWFATVKKYEDEVLAKRAQQEMSMDFKANGLKLLKIHQKQNVD